MHVFKPLHLLAVTTTTMAGPLAYAACQAGCAGLVVACYTAGGFIFGTVTAGDGTPVVLDACNSTFGSCQAVCATVALFAPTA